MKELFGDVEKFRLKSGHLASMTGERQGAFRIRVRYGSHTLNVIISDGSDWKQEKLPGEPWEHVSVSRDSICPTWRDMTFVKELFFDDEECVIQFHPPKSKYVNTHPFVLHMWKPPVPVPMPPIECV